MVVQHPCVVTAQKSILDYNFILFYLFIYHKALRDSVLDVMECSDSKVNDLVSLARHGQKAVLH